MHRSLDLLRMTCTHKTVFRKRQRKKTARSLSLGEKTRHIQPISNKESRETRNYDYYYDYYYDYDYHYYFDY